jgi:hypothetical protein
MPVSVPPQDFKPHERAQFATTARLLSCLVTESLVRAFYQPLDTPTARGFAIILQGEVVLDAAPLIMDDILAIVPLHHAPIFKPDGGSLIGREIGLLDPLDMIPSIFESGSEQFPWDGTSPDVTPLYYFALRRSNPQS